MAEQLICVLGGISLMAVSVGLSRVQAPQWSSKLLTDKERAKIQIYSRFQRALRWVNNRLLALIGGLIVCTAAIPHGRPWMWTWASIFFLLLICIFLAMLDALSSILVYKHSIPSTMRGTLVESSHDPDSKTPTTQH